MSVFVAPDAPPEGIRIVELDHDSAGERAAFLGVLAEYMTSAGDSAIPAARYEWLYLRNPAGRARTFVARDAASGAVLGMTSLFPRRVLVGGAVEIGAIGGDAYVLPSARGRGIATHLHRLAADTMRSGKPSFMFGPPELANLRALLRAGAVEVGTVAIFARPMFPFALRFARGARSLLRARNRLHLERLGDTPDARVDALWAQVVASRAGSPGVLPVADAAFYAWRFGATPLGRQSAHLVLDKDTPIGVVALERANKRLSLLSILAAPGRVRAVYRAALDADDAARAAYVQIHLPDVRSAARLLSLGFIPRRTKPFQVQLPAEHPRRAELVSAAGWRYGWGDGDVEAIL